MVRLKSLIPEIFTEDLRSLVEGSGDDKWSDPATGLVWTKAEKDANAPDGSPWGDDLTHYSRYAWRNSNIIARIFYSLDGSTAYVDMFEALKGPNALGPGLVRKMLKMLRDQHGVTKVTGDRVSGARKKLAAGKRPAFQLSFGELHVVPMTRLQSLIAEADYDTL